MAWGADSAAFILASLNNLGDSDMVRPEHAVEMFRLRCGGVVGDVTGLPPRKREGRTLSEAWTALPWMMISPLPARAASS
jgi:hypothetical protein